MKKLIIFMLLLIPVNVFSEEVDYEVIENKKNKYYTIERNYDLEYHDKYFHDDYYINRDDNDFIYEEFISNDLIEEDEDITLLEDVEYVSYSEYRKAKYIMLWNINSPVETTFTEISIYDNYNRKNVNYNILEGSDLINDNDRNTGYIVNDTSIILELEEELPIANIEVSIWAKGEYMKRYYLTFIYNNTGNINDLYYTGSFYGFFGIINQPDICILRGSFYKQQLFEEKISYAYKNEELGNVKILDSNIVNHKYQRKLYRYYNEKRNYLDGYYNNYELDDKYIKDEEDFIIEYEYKPIIKEDEIIIDENKDIVIENNDVLINNEIKKNETNIEKIDNFDKDMNKTLNNQTNKLSLNTSITNNSNIDHNTVDKNIDIHDDIKKIDNIKENINNNGGKNNKVDKLAVNKYSNVVNNRQNNTKNYKNIKLFALIMLIILIIIGFMSNKKNI